ncbi:LLGL2 [Nesidiocoris tenuis]|uniref:LLGL2 n=1 Tax=Nesidiocoris tenuis TaxID=355587 RepID=A0ABN7ANS7_9HEMI|nr:LLGL2 [Nesidiocoris tenuis]
MVAAKRSKVKGVILTQRSTGVVCGGYRDYMITLLFQTFRHGFPYQPTAVAFDPIQKLVAIGCKNGSVRIIGRFGVDCHVWHEGEGVGVIQIVFLVNEGALITATTDDCVHLWNFRQKRPDLVHSLQFQRERITCIFLPLQSKWLYVGTQKGNVHVVNIESFQLSGYIINWNKAIELSRKTHPGCVVHLSDNPLDPSKLLVGFETGQLVLWDLRLKQAEIRWQSPEPLKSVSWFYDGKQFLTSHTDGTILTWSLRQPGKAVNVQTPHAKVGKDGKLESCRTIQKVEWKAARSGEVFIIFCGGMSYEKTGRPQSITIMQGKSTTVLEMEQNVVDFITLCESPYASDVPEPYAILVILQNDMVVLDLLSAGFPCFESPHPMDLNEYAVTCCTYLADCPSDLIPAFYSVGSKSKRTGYSDKEWPLAGGEWTTPPCSYSEIIITGHSDGSIKFWDASCGTLQVLYKLKTSKVFERPTPKSQDGSDDDPFAVQHLSLCPESRKMCVAGAAGYVVLFKFKRQEATSETVVLDIPVAYELFDDTEVSPECDYSMRGNMSKLASADNQIFGADCGPSVKVKPGLLKKPPGFQAVLVCLSPAPISSLGLNSSYGLLAYGTDTGAVIVDIVHKVCLLNIATPDLYGGADPYQRVPKSPKRTQPPDSDPDRCRSPSIDQGVDVVEELNQSGSASPHDEHEIEPRKKKFNLKKQLSRVDIKLKFQPRNNKRSNSVFYADNIADESPTSLSPDEEIVPVIKEPELTDERPERPSELPLFEERPTPPPRKEKKEPSKRDARLLSVPNIKYHQKGNQSMSSLVRKMNKLDSSFSRSRSSSMSSLENISSEAVQCIAFADSYTKKTDSTTFPTLWLGTSLGSVLTIMLNVPSSDIRSTQPVTIGPFGTMFRLKGSILTMSFLDCNGALIPYTFESWRDDTKDKQRSSRTNSNSSRMSPPGSATSGEFSCDRQFVVIVSEKQAIVAALPSHNVVYKIQITEVDFVVKAEIISLKDSVCLICYVSNGHICAYSLPSLRSLIDADFLPLADLSFQTRKPGIVDPMLSIWGQQMFVNEDTDQ